MSIQRTWSLPTPNLTGFVATEGEMSQPPAFAHITVSHPDLEQASDTQLTDLQTRLQETLDGWRASTRGVSFRFLTGRKPTKYAVCNND